MLTASINRRFVHGSERNHGMIDIVSRPSHTRNIIPPKFLTRSSADCIDRLGDELMVKGQRDIAYVEKSVISYVQRTGPIAGHSSFERLFREAGTQYLFCGVAFAVDVG